MGFYFRKSVNFGPFRFNFSRSGIGVSTGVKGFRVGTGPNGNYVHMGRKGIYYKKTFGKNNNKSQISSYNNLKYNNINTNNNLESEKIESQNISEIVDSTSEELIKEINEKQKLFSYRWLSLFGIFNPVLFLILFIVFYYIDKNRKTVIIVYDIDTETEQELQKFYDSFNDINKCHKKWQIIESMRNADYKYHSGASNLIKRININITMGAPSFIKTNVKVPCINMANGGTLCFLPDKLLIIRGKEVGALSYENVKINKYTGRFIEEEEKPFDGTVIDYTWRYVNKSGGPDLRFSNNPRIPIMEYTYMDFLSTNGLNEKFMLSKAVVGDSFINELERLQNKEFKDNYDDFENSYNIDSSVHDNKTDFDKINDVIKLTENYLENEISVKKEESIVENVLVETKEQDSVVEEEKNINISNNVNENQNNRKNMFLKKEN